MEKILETKINWLNILLPVLSIIVSWWWCVSTCDELGCLACPITVIILYAPACFIFSLILKQLVLLIIRWRKYDNLATSEKIFVWFCVGLIILFIIGFIIFNQKQKREEACFQSCTIYSGTSKSYEKCIYHCVGGEPPIY